MSDNASNVDFIDLDDPFLLKVAAQLRALDERALKSRVLLLAANLPARERIDFLKQLSGEISFSSEVEAALNAAMPAPEPDATSEITEHRLSGEAKRFIKGLSRL